jgi:glycosyltransferase involved in cell wall biosynthesis
MHILIVTNYFAPESGAAAVRLTRLAKKLQQRGHQITVLTSFPHYPQGLVHSDYRGKAVVMTDLEGIRVVQTWLKATTSPRISRKLLSQISFMASALLFGLRIARPNVVFIEAQPVFTSVAGVLLAFVKRSPYVLNVSDLWPDHLLAASALTERHPVYRLARRVVDTTYRRAARIVAMSPRWAEEITSYLRGDDRKVSVIYNGVDLNHFRPQIDVVDFRRRHKLGNDKVLSFIGTFSSQYDFDAMLAVAKHFDKYEGVQILFVGQGSQDGKVRDQIGSFARLKWIPWLSHEEVPSAWNASWFTYWAVHDHPLFEGTIPAKLFEAMACGVPMITAMRGCTAEIIKQSGAGAAVPPRDVSGLIREMEKILADDALRQQYSAAARRYAEARYDAEGAILAYESTLAEAAGQPAEVVRNLS